MKHLIPALVFSLSILTIGMAGGPAAGQLLPDVGSPASHPPVPCHKKGCRADESIVMDVDYTHYASDRNADVTALTSDIEAQIDEVAARHPIVAHDGLPRRIIWTTVDGPTHECQAPTDAGILEIEDAELLDSRHQYVFIGQQREEARLAFRILGCAGDERMRFPQQGVASVVISPTYFSIYGTVGLITLLRSGANNNNGSTAAVLATVAGNSSLEPDIGSHSVSNLRALVRHRLAFGRKTSAEAISAPPAGSLAAFFTHCKFTGIPINMQCDPDAVPAILPAVQTVTP